MREVFLCPNRPQNPVKSDKILAFIMRANTFHCTWSGKPSVPLVHRFAFAALHTIRYPA